MKILNKIFRFFFPKGGFSQNFYGGINTGKEIGKQKTQKYLDKKSKKK